mmetsp:Transcript_11713/g.35323  ORF Transcript_11713/g.35323 Transcript_11713/m.35323 type:complete len:273 (-) Transcript_11713:66-884(-)
MPAKWRMDTSPRVRATESGRMSQEASMTDVDSTGSPCSKGASEEAWAGVWTSALVTVLVLAVFGLSTAACLSFGRHHLGTMVTVAFVFAFAPWIDEIWLVQRLAGTMPVGATYTCWNCLLLTYTVADFVFLGRPPILLPCLVINSWAIWASFNVVRLFESSFYERAAKWTGYGLLAFHVFNQLFHTLPAVFSTLWFLYRPAGSCSLGGSALFGTVVYHFLYALRIAQSLFLDKVYFECPRWQWGIAWITALLVHVAVGREVSWQCDAAEVWL